MWTNRAQQITEIKRLVSTGKIAKQIAAIKDPAVRTAIEKYVTFQLHSHPTGKHPNLIIMDMYGIARMLREFDKTIDKHNSQFKGTSQNIIYYVGADHVEKMRLFFKYFMGIPESRVNVEWYPKTVDGCKSFINLDVGNSALNFF